MIGLTMRQLRYFNALAQHGHFGRAADACSITQPALSVQIKELEALIGAPLVERSARQIRLTRLGQAFAERAKSILQSVDDIEDLVRSHAGPFSGQFRLGIIPTVAPYLLPQIIAELGQRFPDLQVAPRESVTASLISNLLDGNLEAAIVALPISEPDLREFALFDEDFVLVQHESDSVPIVPGPQQLQEMKLLLLEEGHCFRDQALSFCTMNAAAPQQLMEGSSLSTLVQMVGSGIGVTLIPEISLPLETRCAKVSISRFTDPPPSRTIGMVWRKTSPLSEQMMELGSIVRLVGTRVRDQARADGF